MSPEKKLCEAIDRGSILNEANSTLGNPKKKLRGSTTLSGLWRVFTKPRGQKKSSNSRRHLKFMQEILDEDATITFSAIQEQLQHAVMGRSWIMFDFRGLTMNCNYVSPSTMSKILLPWLSRICSKGQPELLHLRAWRRGRHRQLGK
jgi:hypothetical protein